MCSIVGFYFCSSSSTTYLMLRRFSQHCEFLVSQACARLSRRPSTVESLGISLVALRFLSESNLTPARTKSDGGRDNVAAESTDYTQHIRQRYSNN